MVSNLTKSNTFQMDQVGSRIEKVFKAYDQNGEDGPYLNKETAEELIDYMARQLDARGAKEEILGRKLENFKAKNMNTAELEKIAYFQRDFIDFFICLCGHLRNISSEQLYTLSVEELNVLANQIYEKCRVSRLSRFIGAPFSVILLLLIPLFGWAELWANLIRDDNEGSVAYLPLDKWRYMFKFRKLRKQFGPDYFPYATLLKYKTYSWRDSRLLEPHELAQELREFESCQKK